MEPVDVLLIDDNPGDVVLAREAAAKAGLDYRFHVTRDGEDALDFVRREGRHVDAVTPELIVLDLRLPRKSGREVLLELDADPDLCRVPLVVLSSSRCELELARRMTPVRRACMVKPGTFSEYTAMLAAIERFRVNAATEEAPPA